MSRNSRPKAVTDPQTKLGHRPQTGRTGSTVNHRPHTGRVGSASPRRKDKGDNSRGSSLSPGGSGGRGPTRSPQGSPTREATQQELPTRSSPLLAGRRPTSSNLPGVTTPTCSNPEERVPGERGLSPAPYSSNVFVLQQGSNVLRRLSALSQAAAVTSAVDDRGVPEIIVSDHAVDDICSSAEQGRGMKSISCNTCTGISDRGQAFGHSGLTEAPPGRRRSQYPSLGLLLETRNRSSSMPSVVLPELPDGRVDVLSRRRPSLDSRAPSTPGRRDSTLPSETDLRPPADPGRRHSFTGVRPSLARGSIAELWGSESERQRPVLKGGLWGRRGTMEMEQTVRALQDYADVTSGQNSSRAQPLNEEQWEELRKCRYLRLPAQEDGDR